MKKIVLTNSNFVTAYAYFKSYIEIWVGCAIDKVLLKYGIKIIFSMSEVKMLNFGAWFCCCFGFSNSISEERNV